MGIALKAKRLLTIVLVAVTAGILVIVVTLRVIENQLIYFPPRFPEGFPPPNTYQGEVEEVWLLTADGVRINAFYRSNSTSKQVLLCFHGNAENIGYGLEHLRALAKIGVNILAVDYRGYGKSEGKPDEPGVYHDADAAYDYLIEQRHFRAHDIFIYGHSLGGAVAVNLASLRPCGGLIIQSSFTSARAMARRMFAIPLIEYAAKSRFDSLQKIQAVHAPILIVHGTRDEVAPFEMGQQLFRAAPEPKRFYSIEGAGHNNLMEVGGASYLACLQSFIAESARQ
jgi:pimeloyl-ACP methyl ester carboxylesterase